MDSQEVTTTRPIPGKPTFSEQADFFALYPLPYGYAKAFGERTGYHPNTVRSWAKGRLQINVDAFDAIVKDLRPLYQIDEDIVTLVRETASVARYRNRMEDFTPRKGRQRKRETPMDGMMQGGAAVAWRRPPKPPATHEWRDVPTGRAVVPYEAVVWSIQNARLTASQKIDLMRLLTT